MHLCFSILLSKCEGEAEKIVELREVNIVFGSQEGYYNVHCMIYLHGIDNVNNVCSYDICYKEFIVSVQGHLQLLPLPVLLFVNSNLKIM